MALESIIYKKEGGIATITLNRPEALNALSKKMVEELILTLVDIDYDDSVNVVVLKGAGRAFCAGMDLKDYPLGENITKNPVAAFGPWQAIEDLCKPVVAAVQGYAITGGYLLAISCDIIIASEEAKFADTHAKWGLVPYGGETQRLPRLIGSKRAKEMMFTSDMITAAEAERYGMVNRVVPLDQLDNTALELAKKINQNSQRAVRAIKWLINRGGEMDLAGALRYESIYGRWGRINGEPDEDRDSRLSAMRRKGG
jgi:enoyl-CoA hydratase/carnithine racemase